MFTLTGDIHIIRQNSMCIPYVPKPIFRYTSPPFSSASIYWKQSGDKPNLSRTFADDKIWLNKLCLHVDQLVFLTGLDHGYDILNGLFSDQL